jgi:hypothetical protein
MYELVTPDADDLNICGRDFLPALSGRVINPFNPCAPNELSRTCQDYKPFG